MKLSTPSKSELKTWAWWKKKLLKHFLVLGFLTALIWALLWPWPGDKIASWMYGDWKVVQTFNVCTIFVVSGLTLKTGDIKQSLKQPIALILGLVAILVVTPMLGFLAVKIPFSQQGFATGLAIFCTVPTTLSSGVLLVDQAYGNAALALMLTTASNLIGVASVPFLLKLVISSGNVSLDAVKLLTQLLLTILLPLIIGKLLQDCVPPLAKFVRRHKITFSLISNGSLVFIVWQTLSRAQEDIVNTPFGQLCLLVLAGIAVHLVYLAFNCAVGTAARLPEREFKAYLFMASQKTLPVAVTIIGFLKEADIGRRGLLVVPCVIGHISQLFIDAAIMARWASKEQARLAALEDSADVEAPKLAEGDLARSSPPSSQLGVPGPESVLVGGLALEKDAPDARTPVVELQAAPADRSAVYGVPGSVDPAIGRTAVPLPRGSSRGGSLDIQTKR